MFKTGGIWLVCLFIILIKKKEIAMNNRKKMSKVLSFTFLLENSEKISGRTADKKNFKDYSAAKRWQKNNLKSAPRKVQI